MMWSPLLITLFLSSAWCRFGPDDPKYPRGGTPSPPGSPWPLPRFWNKTNIQMTLEPMDVFQIQLSPDAAKCDVIVRAAKRYKSLTFIDPLATPAEGMTRLKYLQIVVQSDECGYPTEDMHEEYELWISSTGRGVLQAVNYIGVLRGLETFSQLVHINHERKYVVNATVITDSPQYPFRGIMLDTSRHFLKMDTILDNLDAMSYNKMNVFHWHMTDDQSFPFQSTTFPNLTELGTYGPKYIYSPMDVTRVIEEARFRGIRVISEFDTPGHTKAFGIAFNHLMSVCYGKDGKPHTAIPGIQGKEENLDPTNDQVYVVITQLIKELQQRFPDNHIHLGMDEVDYNCWKSSPVIKKFMKQHNMTQYYELENLYIEKTLKNVRNLDYKYIVWQDPIDHGVSLPDDATVHVWKSSGPLGPDWQTQMLNISKRGNFKLLLSSPWYLNYISYGPDWSNYYNVDPLNFTTDVTTQERVQGGEACMWGEYVDSVNLIPRMWPRASAVAERLWSNPKITKNYKDAQYRLEEHHCRMLRRGISSQPLISNSFCGPFELGHNKRH